MFIVSCVLKDKNKEKEAGNGPFFKITLAYSTNMEFCQSAHRRNAAAKSTSVHFLVKIEANLERR